VEKKGEEDGEDQYRTTKKLDAVELYREQKTAPSPEPDGRRLCFTPTSSSASR
jgi:hypothetical protein